MLMGPLRNSSFNSPLLTKQSDKGKGKRGYRSYTMHWLTETQRLGFCNFGKKRGQDKNKNVREILLKNRI